MFSEFALDFIRRHGTGERPFFLYVPYTIPHSFFQIPDLEPYARDTDWTVKLIDVHPPNADYPDGFAQNISDSIIRGRYRNAREQAEPLEPGEVYPFEIIMYPTSNLFGAGHQIRLDVSSSNFPRFDVNPNTGGPLGQERRLAIAENAIYHDPERPSHIVLPIIHPWAQPDSDTD